MHYESLSNKKKSNIDISDVEFQYSSTSQLAEVNRTRKILLFLTAITFLICIICSIIVVYSYIFDCKLGFESYNISLRFLPFISCLCFGFGFIATDRYHVKGLHLFATLVMINIIITYLSVTISIIISIDWKKHTNNIVLTMFLALSYQMIFCAVSFLPAYTVKLAHKLSKLLTDNKNLTIK